MDLSEVIGEVADQGLLVLAIIGGKYLGVVDPMPESFAKRTEEAAPLLHADAVVRRFLLGGNVWKLQPCSIQRR